MNNIGEYLTINFETCYYKLGNDLFYVVLYCCTCGYVGLYSCL